MFSFNISIQIYFYIGLKKRFKLINRYNIKCAYICAYNIKIQYVHIYICIISTLFILVLVNNNTTANLMVKEFVPFGLIVLCLYIMLYLQQTRTLIDCKTDNAHLPN